MKSQKDVTISKKITSKLSGMMFYLRKILPETQLTTFTENAIKFMMKRKMSRQTWVES